MIGYLEGKLLKKEEDRILLLAGQIGFEVMIPPVVMDVLQTRTIGDIISLFIFFQQTERQPKPVLIGFNDELEKEFFQYMISVEDIGPLKAVKAMTLPIRDIAAAVESKDVNRLKQMKGIGARTAQKMIATLEGRMQRFLVDMESAPIQLKIPEDVSGNVFDVLVSRLGYKPAEAKRMIADAFKRNSDISNPETLIEEIFRGDQPG